MASPPPHLPSISIPRKRNSVSSISSAAKKRKPSQLRNAFSPESEGIGSPLRYSRSPSVDSVATGSIVNSVGGRKRKRKDGDTQSVTGSLRGAKAGSVVTGVEGEGGDKEGDVDEEEEDEEDEEMDAVLEGGRATEASLKQEKEHERLLLDAMTEAQQNRYSFYRRVRLKKETVRKLVNQTLSQSVPAPVILAVMTYSKAFVGELLDRALTVRDEWALAATHTPNTAFPPEVLAAGLNNPLAYRPGAKPKPQDLQAGGGLYKEEMKEEPFFVEVEKEMGVKERLRFADRGPLTPDHLREALRRYKRDREGGGAGVAGMSLEGVERTMGRTGGRRLFR